MQPQLPNRSSDRALTPFFGKDTIGEDYLPIVSPLLGCLRAEGGIDGGLCPLSGCFERQPEEGPHQHHGKGAVVHTHVPANVCVHQARVHGTAHHPRSYNEQMFRSEDGIRSD